MPYISTETLVAGSLLVILALGWQYLPSGLPSASSSSSSASKAKKKNKKKSKGEVATAHTVETKPSTSTYVDAGASGSALQGNSKKRNKTLAEKLLPREPKTKVDDMLAPEDRPPALARVMKVSTKPSSTTTTAATESTSSASANNQIKEGDKVERFSDDYTSDSDDGISPSASGKEDVTAVPVQVEKKNKKANDGWDLVTSKKKKPISFTLSNSNPNANPNSSSSAQSTALPLPTSTKGQKKNAKKAEMKKLAREQDEADRQKRLAMHKKDLEREKINQLYTSTSKTSTKPKINGSGGNGAQASITPNVERIKMD